MFCLVTFSGCRERAASLNDDYMRCTPNLRSLPINISNIYTKLQSISMQIINKILHSRFTSTNEYVYI